MPTFQEEQDRLLAEEEAAAKQEAYQGDAQQSPFDNFPSRPYQGEQPVSEIQPPPEQPQSAPEPYQGQAYPGLPVIQDRGSGPGGADQYTYNGQIVSSEAAAFQARAQDAANPRAQQAFQAAEQQRQQGRPAPGEPDPGAMTSIQLRQEMDRHTLSRADQLELTQLQNGVARVQADARDGRLPIPAAIQVERELRARMQPKMITMQQFHALQMALDYKLKDEHFQQLHRQNTDAAMFASAHAPGTSPSIRDENGRELGRMFIGPNGREHFIPVQREPAGHAAAGGVNGPGGIPDQLHNNLIHEIEAQMHKEEFPTAPDAPKPEWTGSAESRDAEFERRYGRRMDLLTAQRPPNPESVPLMRDIGSRFAAAERQISQPSAIEGGIDNLLGNVGGGEPSREETQRRVAQLNTIRRGLENIVQRYPRPDTMPPVERRRFDNFYRQLNELLAPAPSAARPGNTVVVPPIPPRPTRAAPTIAAPSSSADVPL